MSTTTFPGPDATREEIAAWRASRAPKKTTTTWIEFAGDEHCAKGCRGWDGKSGEVGAPPEVLIAAGVEALRRTKREAVKTERSRSFLRPWRVQGANAEHRITSTSDFDELVVADWLHVEVMDRNHVWMRVGPLMINVTTKRGAVTVRIERDGDGEVVVEDGVT